ncbi:MAG: DUF92 domain-containing protein, partial [Brevefilum sp.]
MVDVIVKFLIGLAAGVGIAFLAYRANSLNSGGMLAAAMLGTVVFGLGGVGWAVVLLTFFISASALSKFFKTKKSIIGQNFAKGSRRDAGQVAANGGVGGALALAYFVLIRVSPESRLLPALWLGFCASFAAANADTWATELGVLNPRKPVLISNFKRVPQGTSGGISLVGSLAALSGSALVGMIAVLSAEAGWAPMGGLPVWGQFFVITGAGVLGSFVDSYLGATVQAVYFCPACKEETERHPTHVCGTGTDLKRGLPWLNNDWVNTACTL